MAALGEGRPGQDHPDMSLYIPTTGNTGEAGPLCTLRGKKNEETKEICCGDIGAIAKMDWVRTGDTLCDAKAIVKLAEHALRRFPATSAPSWLRSMGTEEKIGTGLNRLNEEDPTLQGHQQRRDPSDQQVIAVRAPATSRSMSWSAS